MKSFNKKILFTSAIAAGLLFTAGANVQAAKKTAVHHAKTTVVAKKKSTKKAPYVIKNNAKLTKEGYVLRVGTEANEVIVGKANVARAAKSLKPFKTTTISPKKVQNVKFRVAKVAYFNTVGFGAPEYFVVSQNGKYGCWSTQSGLSYYYWNQKSLRGVTKPLERIANSENRSVRSGAGKRNFEQAWRAANKLKKGSQKNFILRSLRQLKKDGSMSVEGDNLFIFGL